MRDIKIGNLKLNSREELSYKITVKNGDYTKAELELLKSAENNGDMLDIEITGLVNGDVEQHKKKKIQYLVMNMNTYADKKHEDIEKLKEELYERYNVASRKDLTLEQLDYEIESFKFGIFEYSN